MRHFLRRCARHAGGDPAAIAETFWRAILAAFGNACAYCGMADVPLTMDHVVPVKVLGADAHRPGNVVPACRSCNSSKSSRSLDVFCRERGLDPDQILASAGA